MLSLTADQLVSSYKRTLISEIPPWNSPDSASGKSGVSQTKTYLPETGSVDEISLELSFGLVSPNLSSVAKSGYVELTT